MLSIPESYILLVEIRPGELVVAPLCNTIQVIDLQKLSHHKQTELVHQILNACQEFRFFQLINNGIPEELMQDSLGCFEKLAFILQGSKEDEKVHFWRDGLRQRCHSLDVHVADWPTNPARYREVVGSYVVEVRKPSLRLLELIVEGLGLNWDTSRKGRSKFS
ncbi:unnamed protein product [Camellia sinensis]